MQVTLQNDELVEMFSKQLLDVNNRKILVDAFTDLISFPPNFCQFTTLKVKMILKVFPNIGVNYINHIWFSEQVILVAKNKEMDNLNIKIQNQITSQLHSFKSIDSITNPDEVVNYPIELIIAR